MAELTRDRLTRDVWLWQRTKGHRFSVDDVATAWIAVEQAPNARRVLDLGCGIGSVLLHLAWSLPEASCFGIEAQAVSFELLTRNVIDNNLSHRVAVTHGDLRDASTWPAPGFDLITGTPPYFPPGTALPAADEQRTYARIEHRGGVEAYLATAAALLSDDGVVVICGDSDADARVRHPRLSLHARIGIVPRAPRPPLFSIWVLRRAPAATVEERALIIRDAAGERTEQAARLRAFSGL